MVWPLSSVAFEFQPRVVGIDGAAGEKVSDFLGAHDHIHAHGIAATQRLAARDSSGAVTGAASPPLSPVDLALRLFSDGECRGQIPIALAAPALQRRLRRRQREDIHRQRAVLQKVFWSASAARASSFAVGTAVFAAGKAMRVHESVDVARIF